MSHRERVSSGTCNGARCATPRAAPRMMPFPGQHLKSKGHSPLQSKVLLCLSVLLCHEAIVTEAAYLGGMKAVFPNGCNDHWTLRERGTLAKLAKMTVCVDVRMLLPGTWTAFSYGSPHSRQSELSLQGDGSILSVRLGWNRYRFYVPLALNQWHRVCLSLNAPKSFLTLRVNNVTYWQSTGTATAPTSSSGELRLGCQSPSKSVAKVELYLLRVWDNVLRHSNCENGNVVGWNSEQWEHSSSTVMEDSTLPCGHHRVKRDASNGQSPFSSSTQSRTPSSIPPLSSAPSPLSISTSTAPLPQTSTSTQPSLPPESLTPPPTSTSTPPASPTSIFNAPNSSVSTSTPLPPPTTTSTSTPSVEITLTPPPTSTSTLTPTAAFTVLSSTTTTTFSTTPIMLLTGSSSTILSTTFSTPPSTLPKTTPSATFTQPPLTSPNTTLPVTSITPPPSPNAASPNPMLSATSTTPPSTSLNIRYPNTRILATHTTPLSASPNTSPNTTFSAMFTLPPSTSPNINVSTTFTSPPLTFPNTSPNINVSTTFTSPPLTFPNTTSPNMNVSTTFTSPPLTFPNTSPNMNVSTTFTSPPLTFPNSSPNMNVSTTFTSPPLTFPNTSPNMNVSTTFTSPPLTFPNTSPNMNVSTTFTSPPLTFPNTSPNMNVSTTFTSPPLTFPNTTSPNMNVSTTFTSSPLTFPNTTSPNMNVSTTFTSPPLTFPNTSPNMNVSTTFTSPPLTFPNTSPNMNVSTTFTSSPLTFPNTTSPNMNVSTTFTSPPLTFPNTTSPNMNVSTTFTSPPLTFPNTSPNMNVSTTFTSPPLTFPNTTSPNMNVSTTFTSPPLTFPNTTSPNMNVSTTFTSPPLTFPNTTSPNMNVSTTFTSPPLTFPNTTSPNMNVSTTFTSPPLTFPNTTSPNMNVSTTFTSPPLTFPNTTSPNMNVSTTFTSPPLTFPNTTSPNMNVSTTFTSPPLTFPNTTSPNMNVSTTFTSPPLTFPNTTSPNMNVSTTFTSPPLTFPNTTSPNMNVSTTFTSPPLIFPNTTSPNMNVSTMFTSPPSTSPNTTSPNMNVSTTFTSPPSTSPNTTSPNTTISTTLLPALPNTLLPGMSTATTPANTSSEGSTSIPTSPYDNSTGALVFLCSFSESCANATAFYWMDLEVNATGVQNESDVTAELTRLFNIYDCVASNSTSITVTPLTTPANMAVTTSNTTVLLLSSSQSQSTTSGSGTSICNSVNETTRQLFQAIKVTCDTKENISLTQCSVLLQLSNAVDTCRLVQVLQTAVGNIQTNLLGSVETVAQGHCPNSMSSSPAGDIVMCDTPTLVSSPCQYSGLVNVTCDSYAETVYVPLMTNTPGNVTCPPPSFTEQQTCSFSAYCNATAGFYTFDILANQQWAQNDLQNMIASKLNSSVPPCNISTETPGSYCSTNNSLIGLTQAVKVNCPSTFFPPTRNCSVYLMLAQRLNVCDVWSGVNDAFSDVAGANLSSSVVMMAIYSLESGPTADLWNLNFSMERVSFNRSLICHVTTPFNNMMPCGPEKNIYTLLNETCSGPSSSPSTSTSSTTFPATSETTVWANTTVGASSTTENSTAVAYNATTIGANATNSGFGPIGGATTPSSNTTVMSTTVSATTVSVEEELAGLLVMTSDVLALNSSEVEMLVSKLQQLLSGPNVSLAVGNTTIAIVSNLLNASASVLAASSTRLIEVVDTVGIKLVLTNGTQTIQSPSLALAVKKMNGTNFQQTSFTILDPNNVQVSGGAKLGRSVLPQASITLPASLTSNLTPEEQLQASRVQFNFYQKSTLFVDPSLGNRTLNSGILGSSVSNLTISGLKDNVVFTLRNNEPIPANFVASCVFWDFSRNGGQGGWNSAGCFVQNSTDEETICSCNHLTSFGVLLDISGQGITNPTQMLILTYITYIGCGISAIFLSVTLLTYLAFEKLRKDIPSKILIHLCLALLLLNLVFLLDSWLALYSQAVGLCISTAFFLHYFLLASFTWMGLEAFHMYLALVKVFNTYVPRYMVKFGLVGWGVPLIVVIIVIAISKDNYGLVSYGRFPDGSTDDFCWIKNNVAFYVAVVAYFCLIFLLNMAIFVVVLVQLCRIKRQNPHNTQHRNVWQEMRSVAGLTFLLGLTWGFAFFAWGPVNLAFMYLFCIFNCLQGFFIFVFHCAVKDVVRRQWRTYLCCGKLWLPENSDWSQTATQKATRNQSRVMATSSRLSNSESNNFSSTASFLPRDQAETANGIGNPLEDAVITALEQPSEDVVLNEINSRHRHQREH